MARAVLVSATASSTRQELEHDLALGGRLGIRDVDPVEDAEELDAPRIRRATGPSVSRKNATR